MSTWYKAGTASFANGSATVTGSGTSWVDNVKIGDALRGPDGRTYEIVELVSSAEIEISPAYEGSSESNADYAIQPTRGILQRVFNQIQTWLDAAAGFGTAAEVDVTTSSTDDTEGRVTKVGDGGVLRRLPSEPDILDPSIFLNGVTFRNWASITASNTPDSIKRGQVICGRSSSNRIYAFAFGNGGFAVNHSDDNGGTWSGWLDGYHTGNLVGTVSQSGGDPTGSVIERGSNSNGAYVRYADGTQKCWIRGIFDDEVPSGTGGSVTWDFPATFENENDVVVSPEHQMAVSSFSVERAAQYFGVSAAVESTSSCRIGYFNSDSSDRPFFAHAIAVGRWF